MTPTVEASSAHSAGTLWVVLDTPAVLDAWWFGNPRMHPVKAALESGHAIWHATASMRQELEWVTARASMQRWKPQGEHPLTALDRWAKLHVTPPAEMRVRCRDASDQAFIDLALHLARRQERPAAAVWLLTPDRDLLNLARRARSRQVCIVGPSRWGELPEAAGLSATPSGGGP